MSAKPVEVKGSELYVEKPQFDLHSANYMLPIRKAPTVFLLSTVLTIVGALAYSAFCDPGGSFLPPSLRARWILAPHYMDGLAPQHAPIALFKKEFDLSGTHDHIVSATVKIAAARALELYVNGVLVTRASDRSLLRFWRVSTNYSIERLLRPGQNQILARVENSKRTPGLLATITVRFSDRSAIVHRSDQSWQVTVDDGKKWSPPEEVSKYREFWTGHLDFWRTHPDLFNVLRVTSAILTALFLGLAILFCLPFSSGLGSWFSKRRASGISRPLSLYLQSHPHFFSRLPLIAIVFIYIPLSLTRDPYSGWDAQGHIEYIFYVLARWGVPYHEASWQMYQPPAYYFLAATAFTFIQHLLSVFGFMANDQRCVWLSLKFVQLLTPLFAWVQLLFVRRTLTYFCVEGSTPYIVGTTFAVLLPMHIYVSQFISNEMMSSLTITISLYLLVRMLAGNQLCSYRRAGLLGGVIGLACLTKYTGLIVLAATSLIYFMKISTRQKDRRHIILAYLVFLTVVALSAGPFYFRNYLSRGTPIYFPQYSLELTMEYRDLSFYISPSCAGLGSIDKYLSRTISFPDGNYSSMWLDISELPTLSSRLFDYAIYFLAILPTVFIAYGFGRSVRISVTDPGENGQSLLMVLFFVLSLAAYVQFLLRIFTWEVVRAFYILSSVSPMTVFLYRGVDQQMKEERKSELILRLLYCLFGAIAAYYLSLWFKRLWGITLAAPR